MTRGLFPPMLYFYLKIISSQVKSSHHFRPIYRQESCVLAAAKAGLSLISLGTAWIQGILITVVLRKKVCLDPRPIYISRCFWKDFIMIPPPASPHFNILHSSPIQLTNPTPSPLPPNKSFYRTPTTAINQQYCFIFKHIFIFKSLLKEDSQVKFGVD